MELDVLAIIQQYSVIPVAVVCLLLGAYLKNKIPEFPNRFIPLALTAVALVCVLWMNDWAFTPENVLAGIFSAALAVYIHQNGKHLFTQHKDAASDKLDTPDAGGDAK